MQTRQYQIDHIEAVKRQLEQDRIVLMQDPTGAGKTYMFALVAQSYIRTTGKSVLILVHRKELMTQGATAIRDVINIEPYLITANTKKYAVARVYIGMVESVVSRTHMFDNVGMVIIDECHIANFNKIHAMFMDEIILGCSATPISSSKKHPMRNFYNSIVCGPQIKELIGLGFLSQNITRTPVDIVDTSQFSIDRMSDDFNVSQMATAYQIPRYVTNVVKYYRKYCRKEKTLIFNVNLAHSNEVAECFRACGYDARHLGSDNEHERDEILKWFKETEDAILCNVMIATVGFDEPSIRNIILNFSTLSLPKFIQCSGRGSRVMDEWFIKEYQHLYRYQLETKDYFNIIDLGGNSGRFGDWNSDRDWRWIFYHPDIPGNGVAPVKTCPNCEGLVHAAVRMCPLTKADGEACLHEFKRRQTPEEQDLEELILVTKGINVEELVTRSKKKYEYYPMVALVYDILRNLFEAHPNPTQDIINKYFRNYYKLCCEWYKKFKANEDNISEIENSGWHITMAKKNFMRVSKQFTDKDINVTVDYDWNEDKKKEDEFLQVAKIA
jgi:superfamily II DNA or RNA helicase